jgi:hypothetical protein
MKVLSRPIGKVAFLAVLVGLSAAIHASAQAPDETGISVQVTAADRAAVSSSRVGHPHYLPAKGANEFRARQEQILHAWQDFSRVAGNSGTSRSVSSASQGSLPRVTYPSDLSFSGGATVDHAHHHAIYMLPNGVCPIATCWGNPEGFLRDLSRSDFIHVTDQYVGTSDEDRYPVGQRAFVSFTPPRNFSKGSTPFTDADMQAVVHAVASALGESGYGHIYHVFLPQGTDECMNAALTSCYSPDNGPTFFFCAYHGSADFSDIGHVLYTVELFEDIGGCDVAPGTPNGQMVDSTNSVLSHETFETITDPDVAQGSVAWNQLLNWQIFGAEIGDECQTVYFPNGFAGPAYGGSDTFSVDDRTYAVQTEYNNARHSCTIRP